MISLNTQLAAAVKVSNEFRDQPVYSPLTENQKRHIEKMRAVNGNAKMCSTAPEGKMAKIKKLHEAITEARAASGMSLTDLAKATGIAGPTLSRIENGLVVEPSFYKIVQISKALGVSLNALAATDIPQWCSPEQRDARRKVTEKTWRDPAAAAQIKKGARRAAKKMHASLTFEKRSELSKRNWQRRRAETE